MRTILAISYLFAAASAAQAQSDVRQVTDLLGRELQSTDVTGLQLRQYAMRRVTAFRVPATEQGWAAEAMRIRRHLLNDVVFHGWPKDWIDSPPRFEDAGRVDGTEGYRATRLRYEVVPGYFSSAVLYEPLNLRNNKVPALRRANDANRAFLNGYVG